MWRNMVVLDILLHPHPLLRQKAEAVSVVADDIKKTLHDMLSTMYHAPGIGLAAPQIGVSKRLVVIDLNGEADGARNPIFMINPEIISQSGNKTTLEEGCLSLPHMRVDVVRPDAVTVRFLDLNGVEQIMETTGLLAKCVQHEMDHLDGKLIFDYLSPLKRDIALRRYQKNLKFSAE
jgi:peptide deformylase